MPTSPTAASRAASSPRTQPGGSRKHRSQPRASGRSACPGRRGDGQGVGEVDRGSTRASGRHGRPGPRPPTPTAPAGRPRRPRSAVPDRCRARLGPVEHVLDDPVVHPPDHARPEQPDPAAVTALDDVPHQRPGWVPGHEVNRCTPRGPVGVEGEHHPTARLVSGDAVVDRTVAARRAHAAGPSSHMGAQSGEGQISSCGPPTRSSSGPIASADARPPVRGRCAPASATSVRHRMADHTVAYGRGEAIVGSDDWTVAAVGALADGGLAAVAVEPLAARLGATKGSFYWHFASRDAFVAALRERWERTETEDVIGMIETVPDVGHGCGGCSGWPSAGAGARVEFALQPTATHPLVAPGARPGHPAEARLPHGRVHRPRLHPRRGPASAACSPTPPTWATPSSRPSRTPHRTPSRATSRRSSAC